MDVQTDNMDPLSGETQPSGKIRKGFKLFGKRKPGNIFSIRSKGEGNHKSPVRSKTLDGLSESAAPEQEPVREKGHEGSQGENEQPEEEQLDEDGVLAAAPVRTSISSTSSAKSLSFLSLLRGGRRGTGGRRVHTVSQPVSRQRRGLKGLFGNVMFLSKDKEDKEEPPPSPLLMSSRANSVEIIKEDLPLTPKAHPRSLDSPVTCEPIESLTTTDSAATTPSDTVSPPMTRDNLSRTNEYVPPLPVSQPPMVPGDNSLSSLMADISSLLTFDSISGGGDIMADVEAEWGKASSAISSVATEAPPLSTFISSKPTVSSPLALTSFGTTASTSKPSSARVPTTASTQYHTTTTPSSPSAKPSSIITTLTKSSTLTTQSVKLSSASAPTFEPSITIAIKPTPTATATASSTNPVTLTTFSASKMSFFSSEIKSTQGSTFTATAAPPNTPAAIVKAPTTSASVSRPSPVVTPPPAPAKPPPVVYSPPCPVVFTPTPPAKLDPVSSFNLTTFTSNKPFISATAGESKAPGTVLPTCTITTKPSSPAPLIPSKMTTFSTSAAITSSVSAALPNSIVSSSPLDLKKIPPSLVTVPDLCTSSSPTPKTQPSPAAGPIPSSTPLAKMTPAPTQTPAPITEAVVSTVTPPPLVQIPVSKSTPPPASIPISVPKDLTPPAPAQIPIPVSKDLPPPAPVQVPQSKGPPNYAQIPVSVSKDSHAIAQIPVSVSKPPIVPTLTPVTVSKDIPSFTPVSQPKAPLTPPPSVRAQVSVSPDPPAHKPVALSKSLPPPAQIPVSQAKATPAPTSAPCSFASIPSTPRPSEVPAPAEVRISGQATVDRPLAGPCSKVAQGGPVVCSKAEELHPESRTTLQGTPTEKKTPQVKASGLSKIPVVGGGRGCKLPVRESQPVDDEASKDPPTPVLEEERPHFNSQDTARKDKISDVKANVPTSKPTQGESQQPTQPKVVANLPRDSKIPVKHGAPPQTASQIPQAKEPPRTKIPVSKVPVRRVGNKPAAMGGSTQIRK